MFQKSEYKDLCSKYFFLISNKSAHLIKTCLIEIIASQISNHQCVAVGQPYQNMEEEV